MKNFYQQIARENARRRFDYYIKKLRQACLDGQTPEAIARVAERLLVERKKAGIERN